MRKCWGYIKLGGIFCILEFAFGELFFAELFFHHDLVVQHLPVNLRLLELDLSLIGCLPLTDQHLYHSYCYILLAAQEHLPRGVSERAKTYLKIPPGSL